MEAAILVLMLLWFASPKWMGQHLAKTKQWYDYYQRERDEETHKAIVRQRAKNIRRIRNERFRRMK